MTPRMPDMDWESLRVNLEIAAETADGSGVDELVSIAHAIYQEARRAREAEVRLLQLMDVHGKDWDGWRLSGALDEREACAAIAKAEADKCRMRAGRPFADHWDGRLQAALDIEAAIRGRGTEET